MAAKRKRESSAASIPATTGASVENGSGSDATLDRKGKSRDMEHGAEDGHKGPRVRYIAAEGPSSWTKSLDLDRDYAKSLKHIAKKLGVPKEHSKKLRLAHVRDEGREVEIWDDIDYQAFKIRATASPDISLTLKIYGAPSASGSSAPRASVIAKADAVTEGKKSEGKQKQLDGKISVDKQRKDKQSSNTPQTQAQGSRTSTPSTLSQPSNSKAKQPKQAPVPKSTSAYTLPQIGSASAETTSPAPSPSVAPSTANEGTSKSRKSKDKKRKSTSDLTSAPSPASAPYTPSPAQAPSPFNTGRPIAALKFADRYKPARPSPLGPNRVVKASTPVASDAPSPSTTATPGNAQETSARRRNRRGKAKAARLAQAGSESRSNTPDSRLQAAAVAGTNADIGKKAGGKMEGSTDRSPPKKRSRKSISKDQSTESTPAPDPAVVPEVTMTPSAIEPSAGTFSGSQSISEGQAGDHQPSSMKVLRVSNEEYDLKQKPKESSRKSSSVTGEKKRKSKQSVVEDALLDSGSGVESAASTIPAADSETSTSNAGLSTPSVDNTVLIPESPPTVSKALPTKRPVGRPKKTQAAAPSASATIPIPAPPLVETASTSTVTPTLDALPPTGASDEPATPITARKGKGKAAASKARAATTSTPVPAAINSSPTAPAENAQSGISSSPAPSSDPPSGTDSVKKRKPAKPKKKETLGPTVMEQIIERLNKRLAAGAATQDPPESGASAPAPPAADLPPSLDSTATADESNSVAQSSSQANPENVAITPAVVEVDVPAVSAAPVAEVTPDAHTEPEVEAQPTAQPPVVAETASTSKSPVVEAATSSQTPIVDPAPSSQAPIDEPLSSTAPSDPLEGAPLSPDEATVPADHISLHDNVDVEMNDATADVEPAAESTASQAREVSPIAEITTPAQVHLEEDAIMAEAPAAEQHDDILVPETVVDTESDIPQPQQKATSTPSTSRATKGRKPAVPCVICLRTPWHYQKDCPEVKAGADSLRYLLSARRDQNESLTSEEDGSHFDQSIEAIQEWVERLENIAGKVQGVVKKDGFKPRSPVKVMGSKDGQTVDLNADSTKKAPERKVDESIASPLPATASESSKSPEATTTQLPDKTTSTSSKLVQTPPESALESPSNVPDTYNFPPIHLRAMRQGRRPGSTSALSVSDAIIETEPSDDSSSDEDDQSESDNAADEAEDGGSESDTSSVVSTTSAHSSDTDMSSNSGSATSRVAMPSNPSDAMRFSLTRDLSEREKKKARLSAAKMQPVTFDQESVIDDNDHEEEQEEEITPPMPAARARAGSDSSIGDFGDDASRRSSIDSTTTAPYRSQAPPVIASSAQPVRSPSPSAASEPESIEDPVASASTSATADIATPAADDEEGDEGTPSTVARPEDTDAESEAEANTQDETTKSSGQMSRSFRDIDGTAASSPDLDDSAGLEAVQQGIADEEDGSTSGHAEESENTTAHIPVATQSLSQARRTRRSSAFAGSQEAPVPASQPLRRSSRTSVPPPDLPARLRSVSREVQERTPPPSSRASRSMSRSMASMSPSTPRARRASNNLPRVEEADVETPKQVTPRRTRSTRSRQPDQPESSFPLGESSRSFPQTQSQPTAAIDRHTQPTPVRRSTRTSPSPLFMTQGSQFPATQFYNPYPETLSASQTQTESLSQGEPSSAQPSSSAPVRGRNIRNAKVNGHKSLATSPIIEEREQEQDQDQEDQDMSFTSQTLPGDTQPSPSRLPVASQVDADGDVEMNENDAESRASDSSDDEDDDKNDNGVEDDLASIPDIQPPKPRNLPPSSQTSTTPIYPSLSSLPKEFLRKSWANMFGNGNSDNASGPTTPVASRQGKSAQSTSGNGNGDESDDDSGSSSDSSVERAQAPPSILKGRFASGGMERKKAASQPAGW